VLGLKVGLRAWVPIDDDHMMFWNFTTPSQRYGFAGGARQGRAARPAGGYMDPSLYLPNSSDWLGRWRLRQNATNDYQLDPEEQRSKSYTGIAGIHQQDQAITESMGPLMDRTQEHLGAADVMIIRTRQRIMKAAQALQEDGTVPPGVDAPEVFAVRTGSTFLARGANWLEATEDLRKAFVEHPALLAEAEAGRF
jgi:phthalate 4,5-dioxygenase